MIEIVIAAILAFIGTNIDDIFINTLFFAQAETKKQVRSVVAGQYAGIGILVLISMFGEKFQVKKRYPHAVDNYTTLLISCECIAFSLKRCYDLTTSNFGRRSFKRTNIVQCVLHI